MKFRLNEMTLHFYPGQHLLVVRDKRTTRRFEAWGGPAKVVPHPGRNKDEEPTWPGTYIIDQAKPYVTPTWGTSVIKWGTPLKDLGETTNDVLYQLPSGKWGSIKKDFPGTTRQAIIKKYRELYNQQKVPATWVFNDFGPVAIRWFKDLDGNRKLNGNERLSGQMFHTTAENEAEHARKQRLKMVSSHGCIHLKPQDRDTLFIIGAFKPGTIFIVHPYHESL